MSDEIHADHMLERAAEEVRAIVARLDAERATKPPPAEAELKAGRDSWAEWQVPHNEVMRLLADAKRTRASA